MLGAKGGWVNIQIAESDADIAACYRVMSELRPHVDQQAFVTRVQAQEQQGYRLVFAEDSDGAVAVAGFRVGESLAWGHAQRGLNGVSFRA